MRGRRNSTQPGREIFRSGQALLSYSGKALKVSDAVVLASQISKFRLRSASTGAFSVTWPPKNYLAMHPRDLPEIVAELIIEMPEVRSGLKPFDGRFGRRMQGVKNEVKLVREEVRESSRAIVDGITRGFEPCLNRLLDYNDRLKDHEQRLGRLKNPQA